LFEVVHAAHLPSVAGGSEAEIISQAQMIAIGKQADATGDSLLSWIVRHHQNHHENINHGSCLLIFVAAIIFDHFCSVLFFVLFHTQILLA